MVLQKSSFLLSSFGDLQSTAATFKDVSPLPHSGVKTRKEGYVCVMGVGGQAHSVYKDRNGSHEAPITHRCNRR